MQSLGFALKGISGAKWSNMIARLQDEMVGLRGRGLRVEGRDVDLLPARALGHLLDAEGRAEVVVVLRRPGARHPDLELPLLLQGQRLKIQARYLGCFLG